MQINKTITLLLIGGMLFLGIMSFAAAQGGPRGPLMNRSLNDSLRGEFKELMQEARNVTMNYGQCVADAAGVKNGCFAATNEKFVSCRNAVNQTAENRTEARNALAQCKADSKKELRECKTSFKNEKKTTCAKIKSTFMEKLWALRYG